MLVVFSNISSIFPEMHWKNLRTTVLPQDFYTYSFDNSMNVQNPLSSGLISLKVVLVIPKNFLDFKSDTIEKQGIKNLRSYSCKSNISAVLSDSEVTFLREDEPLLYFLYLQHCIIKRMCQQIFSILLEIFRRSLQLFYFSFFSVLCHVLPP